MRYVLELVTVACPDGRQDTRFPSVRGRRLQTVALRANGADTTYSEVLSVFKRLVPIPTTLKAEVSCWDAIATG